MQFSIYMFSFWSNLNYFEQTHFNQSTESLVSLHNKGKCWIYEMWPLQKWYYIYFCGFPFVKWLYVIFTNPKVYCFRNVPSHCYSHRHHHHPELIFVATATTGGTFQHWKHNILSRFGYLVVNSCTFWWTGLSSTVVYQNWQISGKSSSLTN